MDDIVLLANQDADAVTAARAAVCQALDENDRELLRLEEQYLHDIFKIQDAQRTLRKRYNTMAPISRLPPEILSLAFEAFAAEYWAFNEHNSLLVHGDHVYKTSMCGLLVILHICHHWRGIALNTPALWTRIELSCEPYVQFALAHSGALPLHIFAGRRMSHGWQPAPNMDTTLRVLFPEFSRLRSVQLRITSSMESLFGSAYKYEKLRLQAPTLETLALMIDNGPLTGIPLLSEMDLPRLTSLRVEDGSFPLLISFIRTTLTSLDIAFHFGYDSGWANTMVEVLEQLPLLHHLALSNVHDSGILLPHGQTPSWYRMVHLPQLKNIFTEGLFNGSYDLLHLLDCLDFPADTQITFSMDVPPGTEQYDAVLSHVLRKALVSYVPTRTEMAQMDIPRVIKVSPGPPSLMTFSDSISVELWSSLRPGDMTESPHTIPATGPKLALTIRTHERTRAIARFFELVDLSEVVVLDLNEVLSGEMWIDVFQRRPLPKLQELILNQMPVAEGVLLAMSTQLSPHAQAVAQENPGQRARFYLFPTLKKLTLSRCLFRNKSGKTSSHDPLPEVFRTLRLRSKHGYKLQKLIIQLPINLTMEEDLAAFRDTRIAESVEIEPSEEEYWTSDESETDASVYDDESDQGSDESDGEDDESVNENDMDNTELDNNELDWADDVNRWGDGTDPLSEDGGYY